MTAPASRRRERDRHRLPAWDLLLTEVTDVYPRTGRDFHTGRRAARLLRDAGLQDVQARVLARLTAPGQYFRTFLPALAVLMREEILAGGRITPGQLDSCTAELRQHLSQPGTLTCLPTIWQAWGPGRPGAANPPPLGAGEEPPP